MLNYFKNKRRGFTILEVALTLIIVSMIASSAIRMYVAHLQQAAVGRTAIYMSALADELDTYVTHNFSDLVIEVGNETNNIKEYTWDDLRTEKAIDLEDEPITPLNQRIKVFLQLKELGGDLGSRIYVILLTDAGDDGRSARFAPRPQSGSRFVGKVQVTKSDFLAGWDFKYDISDIQASAEETFLNQIGVIRLVSDRRDISPFLHRIEVPDRPELNTMDGDLNMTNQKITGVNELELETLTVTGDVKVSGVLNAENLVSRGSTVLNTVTAIGAPGTPTVNITTLIADTITSDAIEAGRAFVVNLNTENLQVLNEVQVKKLTTNEARVGTLKATTGEFGNLDINGVLTTDSIITQKLYTGELCLPTSGCPLP